MHRRRFGATALAALLATGGCLGFLTGEEALVFESDPATTAESVASDAEYETDGPDERAVNRSFGAAGQSRTVRVVNHVTTYEKRLDLPVVSAVKLGVFSVVTSPSVGIAGQEFNPLGDYSKQRLVRMAGSAYGGFNGIEQVSSRTVTVFGDETTVTKYAARAPVGGQSVEVFVHVARVRHEDDYVIALGVYPRRFSSEEANIMAMIRAIEHPA